MPCALELNINKDLYFITVSFFHSQNDEQMSLSSPVDSQFFRMLLEEEGNNMRELLDAEEYLVPQPNLFPRAPGDGSQSNGPSRHQSYRVGNEERCFSL